MEIRQVIDNIYTELTGHSLQPPSLMSGESGSCLFKYLYSKYFGDSDKFLGEAVQKIAEHSINYSYTPFCDGKAGINWFFTYLYKQNILDKEDWQFMCEDDHDLLISALDMLQDDRYDFLHGALGIAYHLLYSRGDGLGKFYEKFFNTFQAILHKSTSKTFIPHYSFEENKLIPNQINFGLSHGITSVLKFCIQCYNQGICSAEAKRLAFNVINCLMEYINKDISQSYFPTIKEVGDKADKNSRLAWCYGDLSMAYILFQAGGAFKDQSVLDFSLEVLLHSAKRQSLEDTLVYDAGFCHGSAGVAHMYNRMYHFTKETIFKNACDFWIQKTLDFAVHQDGAAGFKKYNSVSKTQETNFGLLEGIAGVGLVLLSYLKSDFSWDYCLMLNE